MAWHFVRHPVYEYRVSVGKPEGKRPLGRHRLRWENDIKWLFKNLCGGMDWIDLTKYRDKWLRVVNSLMNLRV